ncbi:hypothetical protein [Pseudomonas sp. HY7a-MNA-CIBAN-0227]|uniref:hypothetical protein n=1 Tax=Pseudomonas sp. HY7a-MNA-CIBAN-0227 TaxID=3140474 RepID=UPI0033271098
MKNKIMSLAVLAILTASMSSMSFAATETMSDAECNASKAKLETVLNQAHAENKFKNISVRSEKQKSGCMASYVYKVDTEKEMSELHLSFVKYLNEKTDLNLSNYGQFTKI